jgi:hypothetical protein
MSDRALDAALAEIHVTQQRRRLWPAWRFPHMNNLARIALAAAAALAVAFVGMRFVLPGLDVGATPSPSPTAAPTATPPLLNAQTGRLTPGSYAIEHPPVRAIVMVPAGWEKNEVDSVVWTDGSNARVGVGAVDEVFIDPCDVTQGVRDPGPTVDDLAAAIADASAWRASPPVAATVGGFSGKSLVLTPLEGSCPEPGMWEIDGPDYAPGPEALGRLRLWILDVDGTRIVVAASDRAGATEQQLRELDAIVASTRFEPLD